MPGRILFTLNLVDNRLFKVDCRLIRKMLMIFNLMKALTIQSDLLEGRKSS